MKITSHRKIAVSLTQGFSFAWPVHEGYEVRKNVLVGIGEPTRVIAPAGENGLFVALAKVHKREIKPANFAKEFGLLGHDNLCPREEWKGGDPIPWFRDHARRVSDLLNALKAIEGKDVLSIREWLRSVPWVREVGRTYWFDSAKHDPIRAAREAFSTLINPHLLSVHRHLRVMADGGIQSEFRPRAPIDLVYWQLADYAVGRGRVRHCIECGELFMAADPRRLYCPGKTCAVSRRVRLFRERQKKGRRRQ